MRATEEGEEDGGAPWKIWSQRQRGGERPSEHKGEKSTEEHQEGCNTNYKRAEEKGAEGKEIGSWQEKERGRGTIEEEGKDGSKDNNLAKQWRGEDDQEDDPRRKDWRRLAPIGMENDKEQTETP